MAYTIGDGSSELKVTSFSIFYFIEIEGLAVKLTAFRCQLMHKKKYETCFMFI